MSIYVLTTADFPRVSDERRRKIYSCLKANQWYKVGTLGRNITTVWQAVFNGDPTDEADVKKAMSTSKAEFIECAGVTVKLTIQAGPLRPLVYPRILYKKKKAK